MSEFGFLNKKMLQTVLKLLPNPTPEIFKIIEDIENEVFDIKMEFDGSMIVSLSDNKICVGSDIKLDDFNYLKKEVKRLNKIIDKIVEE